ncbi:hypothetical protein Acsp04_61290 [Actinomadura sp. NBRC 104425]|uniref:GNAT family N-acetyltransferase n=1 Tax=Actinomadura sp. NBRC 104425 TaxID=3032204 RepID=UPI00249FC527|nr:GNAT family N-acetyltransferase [Actinomadura sp. NBRC 104425]GLZ15894.1 hypothetical protein Acsp04_61290 [Actinomadura sp. NBRC 104425]
MTDFQFDLRHHDAADARRLLDTLISVQQEIYANTEPREFFTEDRYRRQITGHMTAPGWELVAAYTPDGEMIGYAYGFPLQAGSGWWQGMLTQVPDEQLRETGTRTFALSELMVRRPWRSKGVGRALHDELLSRRREERATLLVMPDNTAAKAAYARWGWTGLGQLRPSWEGAPTLEALVLPLSVSR